MKASSGPLAPKFIWRPKMARHDPVVLTMQLLTTTDNAILVCDDDHEEGVWLPKSKVEWERKSPIYRKPEIIEVTMPEWLAKDRELI